MNQLERALLALKDERDKNKALNEPIAIIGLSCNLPGASNLESYWHLLHTGQDGITEIPVNRWDIDSYYDADPQVLGKMVTRKGGFIEGIDQFDASFFSISPREAEYLDPQQRLLLEQTWHALEHAGLLPIDLRASSTGVFIGISTQDYSNLIHQYGDVKDINAYIGTGNAFSTATGRISYILGLQGPNMAIDTACSSSLVALHEACKSLQRGECNLAITGGVNALLSPDMFINFSKAGMLAPDGHCKTFDAKADGYARGEGCGIVILKRLSDALRAKDRIMAVIKGSGINQDGASSGLTVPNGAAQEQLLTQVLKDAKLKPTDVDYIECHGTGTSLGDPIEVHAIGQVYGVGREEPLHLGSVKSNIGHLEAAAGIAGLIKAVLALEHEELPKNLHFETLNPHIELNFPAEIVTQSKPWVRGSRIRRAGISAFGFSGTNAHVILEEAPISPIVALETGDWVICLSAKTASALEQLRQDYIQHLESHPDERIQDIIYTANTGRARLDCKAYFKASTRELLLDNLNNNRSTDEPECTPSQGNKLILPTYPFERQRYWLDFARATPMVDESTLSSWCYGQRWSIIKPVMMAHDIAAVETLVIACNPALLSATKAFHGKDKHWHVMGYEQGEGQIKAQIKKHEIGRVILLCQADSGQAIPEQSSQWMGLLLNLTQLLALETIKPELTVVTEHGQWVDKDSSVSLSLAPIMGFMKSMQLELPELTPRLIDVDDLSDISMWSNLDGIAHTETILAIRDGQYYGLRVEKQRLPESSPFTANPEGSYLITGGLGGLGQVVAGWLIERGAKHVVLTSRHAPSREVQLRLDAWIEDSVDVQVVLGDIGAESDVIRILNTIASTTHPLCGVFHLAGSNHDSYLTDIIADDVEGLMRAKVYGAYYLHTHTQSIPLDYFVLFSSISALIGSQKQSIYAASNQFLDQLACHRQQLALPALSIDWGPWLNEGMAAGMFNPEQLTSVSLERGDFIQVPQGLAFLSRWITTPNRASLGFVSPHYLRFMLSFVSSPKPDWVKGLLSQLPQPRLMDIADSDALLNRLLPLTTDAQLDELRRLVCSTVAHVLGIDNPDTLNTTKGFFDLGMDSLIAVELQQRLQRQLGAGVELGANIGFDYPTIEALTTYIHASLLGVGSTRSKPLDSIAHTHAHEPIAVIGMSCRFPGHANNPELLWDLLVNGRDGITEVPRSRWDMDAYYDEDPNAPGKSHVKRAGFIDDIEQFDAAFFNISPREAQTMDPQQRLLLEETYNALTRAGYSLTDIYGSEGGVFVGVSTNEYAASLSQYGNVDDLSAYYATGSALNVIAGRLSYTFGLEGPSEIVDTACSSSLVALHHAIQSLRLGECNFAIAGGVNAIIRPETFIMLSKANMLSPDGHCKTFDAGANGYVRGEGCGVLILKRLSDAIRDKDSILALIRGSAVNQDGASSGLTVPRGTAQQAVIEKALLNAQVSAGEIGYIEAHGTGTSLGDPIEVEALAKTYGVAHEAQPFILGTVKTNIGHLESAAGIAGVIKTILSLEHQMIPAHLNFNELNPHIDLTTAHAQLPLSLMPWVSEGQARRAGVSSFGFSGTNAHVILEEAPILPIVELETGDWVICLSAKTETALNQLKQDYIQHLEFHPDERIQDIVFTANTGRARLDCKAYFKASTRELLLDNLNNNRSTDEPECTPSQGKKLTLPTYPFERQRYWFETTHSGQQTLGKGHPFLLRYMNFSDEQQSVFETDISKTWPEFIPDHYIYGHAVVAGATYLSTMISVIERLHESKQAQLSNVEFIQPVVLDNSPTNMCTIRTVVDGQQSFKISSFVGQGDAHLMHVRGNYDLGLSKMPMMNESLESIQSRCIDVYTKAEHAKRTSGLSYELGPHFSWIEQVNYNEHELIATLRLPDKVESKHYLLYPGFIDACFQTIFAWLSPDTKVLSVPIAIQSFHYDLSGLSRPEYVYIRRAAGSLSGSDEFPALDIYMLDRQGQVLGLIEGFQTRAVTQSTLMNIILQQHQGRSIHYDYVEHWEKRVIVEAAASAPHGSILLMTARQHAFSDALFLEFQHHDVSVTMSHSLCELPLIPVETIILMLTPEESALDIPDAYREQLRVLFDVTQALIQSSWEKSPRLWLVTQGGQRIMPDDEIHLSVSGVMGFYKTLIQEHPEFQARLIDVEPRDASFVAEQFYRLYSNSEQREGIWAIRAENYYVQRLIRFEEWQRLEQHRVKQTATEVLTPPTAILTQINPEQPIIIIGGMGGLGYALAGSCIAHGALTLILTGRKVQDESMTARIDALIEKNTRVKIVYEAVDITNSGDCQRLMSQWADAQIVFNTAGVIEDATLNHLTWEAVNRVILPKVDGTWHLYQALQLLDIPLISFSSIASILGSGGQAAYAAANGFLNALSALSHQQYPLLSIAWGPWADVGMAKDLSQRHLRSGVRALKPDAGLNALWQLLGTKDVPSTVMVADMQWDKLSGLSSWAFLENLAPKTQLDSGQWVAYLQKLVPEKRQEVLRDKIRELVAEVMGMSIASVSDDKDFFELGVDSLMAMELIQRLQSSLGLKLDNKIIFQYPTIKQLASYLLDNLGQIISQDMPQLTFNEKQRYELLHAQEYGLKYSFIQNDISLFNMSIKIRLNHLHSVSEVISKINNYIENNDTLSIQFSKDNDDFYMKYIKIKHPESLIQVNKESSITTQDIINSALLTPFNLLDHYLFRFIVTPCQDGYYEILYIANHLITDIYSLITLEKQLQDEVEKQPQLLQAKFNEQQRRLYPTTPPSNVLDYWLDQLNELLPLQLHQQQKGVVECMSNSQFQLCHKHDLTTLSSLYKSTGFNILLAISSLIINAITHNKKIQFIVPVNSREVESSKTVHGLFIQNQLFVADINWNQSFELFSQSIRDNLQQNIEHYYPVDLLLTNLVKIKPLYGSANFPIVIGYMGDKTGSIELDVISSTDLGVEIFIYFGIDNNGFYNLKISYKKSLFSQEFIKKLFDSYQSVINALVDNHQQMNYRLLSNRELNQLSIVQRKKMIIHSNFSVENIADSLKYFMEDVELIVQEKIDSYSDDLFNLSELGSKTLHIILIDLNQLLTVDKLADQILLNKIKDLMEIKPLNYVLSFIYHEDKHLKAIIKKLEKFNDNNIVLFDLDLEKNNSDLYGIELAKIIVQNFITLGV